MAFSICKNQLTSINVAGRQAGRQAGRDRDRDRDSPFSGLVKLLSCEEIACRIWKRRQWYLGRIVVGCVTANGVPRVRFARAIGAIGLIWETTLLGLVDAVPFHRHIHRRAIQVTKLPFLLMCVSHYQTLEQTQKGKEGRCFCVHVRSSIRRRSSGLVNRLVSPRK